MICIPCSDDIDGMKDLWHICFGDDYEYIDFFFDNRFDYSHPLIFKENGRIISQLFLFDGNIKSEGKLFKSYYLYAACTHPDYRKKGIMSSLLNSAKEYALKNNVDFICLVPAEDYLFEYYSKFGYKTIFSKKRFYLSPAQYDFSDNSVSADISGLLNFRNSCITSNACFVWDENAFEYAVNENGFSGGKLITDSNSYALARPVYSETAYIYEICCSKKALDALIGKTADCFNCKKIILDAPCDFTLTDTDYTIIRCGMACAVSEKSKDIISNLSSAYLGLPLE